MASLSGVLYIGFTSEFKRKGYLNIRMMQLKDSQKNIDVIELVLL